ncbi:MAG: hypothetical protein VYA34_03655 [Myxococcota bacterium]|nr:hypothetical protein [Myxococcota bacterium]
MSTACLLQQLKDDSTVGVKNVVDCDDEEGRVHKCLFKMLNACGSDSETKGGK